MTVRTMSVQPGTDAGAGPGSVPWQGMLWVTWRQHRALLIIVPAAFAAAVAFMLGYKGPSAGPLYPTSAVRKWAGGPPR